MNIERLKSLIRLANNNPNDNEANLAARKACQELAKDDFALLKTTPTVKPATTWNDVVRSNRPMWKSTPPKPPPTRTPDGYQTSWHTEKDPFNYENLYDEIFGNKRNRRGGDSTFNARRGQWSDVRTLTCKTCRKPKQTKFQGLADLYECNDCQWTAYQRKKDI